MTLMNEILVWAVVTAILVVGSFLVMVATIAFRRRMKEETAHILFGLIPLELCLISLGVPFFLALCFFLT